MCSQGDDPTTYDAPEPTRPRVYNLSGDRVVHVEAGTGRGSVALAVLGELLNDAERDVSGDPLDVGRYARYAALLEARDRVAAAEAAL